MMITKLVSKFKKAFYYRNSGYKLSEIITIFLRTYWGGIPQKKLWSYISINLHCLFLLKKKNGKMMQHGSVIVIETGVLGDCMVALGVLQELYRNFNQNLTIVCKEEMSALFKNYGGMDDARYLCFKDRDSITKDELVDIFTELQVKEYEFLLRRDSHNLSLYLSECANAKKKIYYSYNIHRQSFKQQRKNQIIFDDIHDYRNNEFIPDIWNDMLMSIGITGYKTCQGNLSINKLDYDKYILIAPEASARGRCIEPKMCDEIITYLMTKYNVNIYMTAKGLEPQYIGLLREVCNKQKVKLFTELNLNQLSKMVANSEMVVACNSGTIHLAAALNIPSVCIPGSHELDIFIPYSYKLVREETNEPICVLQNAIECKNCSSRGEYLTANPACLEFVASGHSELCIYDIQMDEVYKAIDMSLKKVK